MEKRINRMKHNMHQLTAIRKNIRRIITIVSVLSMIFVLTFFIVRLTGILEINTLSSQLTYDLLQVMFPILLALLFLITALLFKPASERAVPASEPLQISDADAFLYEIPSDEPYLPQITFREELPRQPEPEAETEAVTVSEDDNASIFRDLESFDASQSYDFDTPIPDMPKPEPENELAQKPSAKPAPPPPREPDKFTRFSFPGFTARSDKAEKLETEQHEQIEDTLENRVKQEVAYANENSYDISIAIIRFRFREKNKPSTYLSLYEQAIRDFLGDSSYIYYFKEPALNSYAIIMPFAAFDETQQELIALYRFMKDAVEEDNLIFSCGFASRFDRDLDHDMLMNEAESSLRKALKKRSFSMIGFEPDIDRFNTNI